MRCCCRDKQTWIQAVRWAHLTWSRIESNSPMQGSLTCKHDEQPRLGGSQGVPCKSLTGSWPWQTRPSADELAGGRAGLGCRRGGERGGEGGELSQGPLSGTARTRASLGHARAAVLDCSRRPELEAAQLEACQRGRDGGAWGRPRRGRSTSPARLRISAAAGPLPPGATGAGARGRGKLKQQQGGARSRRRRRVRAGSGRGDGDWAPLAWRLGERVAPRPLPCEDVT